METLETSVQPEAVSVAEFPRELYFKSEARPISALKPLWRKWGQEITFEKWLELRNTARKNLYWLGKAVLKKDLTECHKIPCWGLFVRKNFDGVYKAGYTVGDVHAAIDKQPREKEMLWLDPRGAFKSTIDGIDCVQWMLNCPDIRILILTGEYKLALAFLSEIKGYFYLPDKGEKQLLHKLFPEYILTGKAGTSDTALECPARIHNQKEPSLWVNSITASLSGWHCDVRKGDDVITDENCNTIETRETIKKKFDGTKNLLDEWGFSDIVGTRYYHDDWYGKRLMVAKEVPLRYLCRACWTVKPEFKDVPLKELKPDMVNLLFPEKLTFKSLKQKLMENEMLFRCQQLNEPALESENCTFTEDVLRAHLVREAPHKEGEIYITWDWSFSRTSYSDYSAGAVAKVVQGDGRFDVYILEIVFGRWKPSELAHHIVMLEKKWKPKNTLIEKTLGSELLDMDIRRKAMLHQVALSIVWKSAPVQADAKRNRIKGIETLLNNGNLWFVNGAWIDETFEQFMRYTGERKNKGRKDDIPDAIAYQQFFIPATANNAELRDAQRQREKEADRREVYNRIFETPAAKQNPVKGPNIRQRLFGGLAR